MILHYILIRGLGLGEVVSSFVYMFLVIATFIRVHKDCLKISETYRHHLILILVFPMIFSFLWVIVWPGAFRLWLRGKRLEDTVAGKLTIQRQNRKSDQ